LIERYLPLARRLALRSRRSGEAPDDLIQVASLALLTIVDRWDPEMELGAVRGRDPTVAELAKRLERPHAAVSAALEAHASAVPRSLDTTADDGEHDPATLGDVIGHDDAEYDRAEARTTIERLSAHAWTDPTEGATA
jgi:DNA-directed RNA polymerase specialized sigma subunit